MEVREMAKMMRMILGLSGISELSLVILKLILLTRIISLRSKRKISWLNSTMKRSSSTKPLNSIKKNSTKSELSAT